MNEKDMEELLELPPTSDVRLMAIANPGEDKRLCLVPYTKTSDGKDKALAIIDFANPEEVDDFTKNLLEASQQTFNPNSANLVLQ